jgi:hypothetical protein
MGLSVNPLTGGCCGLAGSWGFENGKYGISLDCGEQALLHAVRAADAATLIVADGFSCMTQIEQAGTGRRALHVAEVMKLARDHRSDFRDQRSDFREDVSNPAEQAVAGGRPPASAACRAARMGIPAAAAVATAALATVWLARR